MKRRLLIMARMRTIKTAVGDQRAADPGCALTETALRRWILTGQIPCVRCGGKYLIDLDVLEEHLRGSVIAQPVFDQVQPIRRV